MEVKTYTKDDTLYVSFSGRLDTMSAPQAEVTIKEAMHDEADMIMDMQELDYISSAGLRLLLSLSKLVSNHGGVMKFKHVNDVVNDVLVITGMIDYFEIIES